MKNDLINKLCDAYDYLYICNGYNNLIKELKQNIEDVENQYLTLKSEKIKIDCLYLRFSFAAVLLFLLGLTLAGRLRSYVVLYLVICIIFLLLAAVICYARNLKKEHQIKAKQFICETLSPTTEKNNDKIKKIQDELAVFTAENEKVLDFLPENCKKDIDAVEYMIYAIKNNLADSLEDALRLYTEQKQTPSADEALNGASENKIYRKETGEFMPETGQSQHFSSSGLSGIEALTFLDAINRY